MDNPSKTYNLPSRAQLGLDSMFAPTEERRDAAKALLAMLKEAGVKEDAQEWRNTAWVGFPPEEIMKLSPDGRRTLAMFEGTPKEIQKAEPGNVAAAKPAPPEPGGPVPEPDDTNEYMKTLNWPPQLSPPRPKDPVDDDTAPHRWQAGRPSAPDKSMRPLPPDPGDSRPPIDW